MMRFVYRELVQVFHSLYSRFLKQEVIEDANTSAKLLKLDLKDPKIWCDPRRLILVLVLTNILKKESHKNKLRKQRKSFNEDCIKFLSSMVSKLAERSPLNYKIVSLVSALDPNYIISRKVSAEKKFKKLVKTLYERDWITAIVADNAKQQFFNLTSCAKANLNEKFEKFTENNSCLDDFYYDIIGQDKSYKDLWFVIKIVVENLHEESLVAQ